MGEHITFETEPTGDPDVVELITTETLTDHEEEVYRSPEEGEEGTPLAQMLFHGVDGLRALVISDDTLTITRYPDVPWETLIDEIRDALRDFFL